jgi:hypothetical protein
MTMYYVVKPLMQGAVAKSNVSRLIIDDRPLLFTMLTVPLALPVCI